MYAHGIGVDKDLRQAVKWLTLSKAQVHSSRSLLWRLEDEITPEDLAEGQALAERWREARSLASVGAH